MKELTKQQLKETKSIRNLALIPFALLVLFHIFMVYYILPMHDNFLRVYVASRAGGSAHYLEIEQFIVASGIAILVALLAGLLIMFFAHLKMRKSVLVIDFLLVSLTSFGLSIYLAAALETLWGGWGQFAGIVIAFGIWMALIWPVMTAGLPPKKPRNS